jgi:NTE family protein
MHLKIIVFKFLVFAILCNNGVYGQEVGLVLSGGGAKGLAHIGVIRALEENNIPIDFITGTSMGAIIGALYASGYSTTEIEAIIYTRDFLSWSTGQIPDDYYQYYKNRFPNSGMLSFQFSKLDSITVPVFPTNIVPTHLMDLGLLELFAQSSAYALYDFNNLFVPFRCIASDVHSNKSVTLMDGELSSAVRASMTYPFFFNPIELNGVLLFDGGIHNNFPFDVMMSDFEPDIMIGSKVSSNAPPPTSNNLRLQIENMITGQTDYDIEKVGGILIESDIDNVGILDFQDARRIIQAGYETTMENIDRIKDRIERRVPSEEVEERRRLFKNDLPPMIFQNIYVTGSNKYQIDYVINSIRQSEEYFTLERLRTEYYKLVSDDKITSIYPRAIYNINTGIFDLFLELTSETRYETQIGGNISSSSINQGFFGVEYKFLGRNSYNLEGNLYFGRLYSSVLARGKIEYPGAVPIYGDITLTLNRWDFFTSNNDPFFEDVRPSYLIKYDGNLKINAGAPVGTNGLGQIGYTIGRVSDRYYQTENFLKSDTTDRTDFDLNSISFSWERMNFNFKQYPTRGRNAFTNFQFVRGVERFLPGSASLQTEKKVNDHYFFLFDAGYTKYFRINNRISLGLKGEITLSTQEFFSNYTSTLLNSPAFQPIPHSHTMFLESYRAHNFAGAGIIPVIRIRDAFHFRIEAYIFQPYEMIGADNLNLPFYYEKFKHRKFIGSGGFVYQTRVGPASLSVNYYDKTGQKFYVMFNFGYIMFNQKAL